MSRRIEIIGGGPAGLYAARLLKLQDPTLDVTVHERVDGSGETFGFGVGLTESTMRNLDAADPETADQIRALSFAGHDLEMRGAQGTATLHGARNLAIGRATLLRVLTEAALGVGVDYRAGSKADPASVDADVVIAADGVRSTIREKLSAELGVQTGLGRSRFVWCGAPFAVDSAFFSSVENEHGLFVAHAYPYAEDRSTFLIEVDEETWQSAGLEALDAATPLGETDTASVAILEQAFAEDLAGHHLLTNRTRWGRFTNLSLDTWSSGNTVLLGDAAHTAHYTLGSGTKLALEDAIALAAALHGGQSLTTAFETYEATRRPPVERFKRLAGRSQAWWDSYRLRASWPVERLALSYMTRSGNLTMVDYASNEMEATRVALEWLGSDTPSEASALNDWVLSRPLDRVGCSLPHRGLTRGELGESTAVVEEVEWSQAQVWDEGADRMVARASGSTSPLLLTGSGQPDSLGARIDLAERLKLQTDRCVGVALPAEAVAQAATAIAAGRSDFVVLD